MRHIPVTIILGLLIGGIPAPAQLTPPVPAGYQNLYNQLNGEINSFNALLSSEWNGTPYPVLEAAQLKSAASEQGAQLLAANEWTTVLAEMQSLQALGVKAFTVHIGFPLLDPAFYTTPTGYLPYLAFYVQLCNQIHSMGLKLIVEETVIFPEPGLSSMNPSSFYATLTWPEYEQARAQQAALVAQQVQPDYMSLITEPDTEAAATNQSNVNTVSGATNMLNQMLTAIQLTGVTGVSLGAGMGTWLSGFENFAASFAATNIQFVDMHIYPVNESFLPNAITIAQIAQAAGKQVGMTEAWLNKVATGELGSQNSDTIFGRDPFSFWAPLDQSFLQSIVNFAQYQQLVFMAPFFTTYFHTYLNYGTYGSESASQLLSLAIADSGIAIDNAQFTSTGTAFENMFIVPPDTTPPSAPTGLGYTASTSQVTLTWAASTDNVGVAGYNVYRNGTLMNTTAGLVFYDSGLSPSTSYVYSVDAFDAQQNISPLTSITALTPHNPDTTPPTVPTGLTTQPASSTQINLTWTPSTDNVGVAGYVIYRGNSATTVAKYSASLTNSFSDTGCYPWSTYYYAVSAYDNVGNVSAQSAIVSGNTLPDTTPPTVPQNLTVTGLTNSSVSLAWSPSTDLVATWGYLIYRGNSPATLQLIASGTPTTYTDATVFPNRTYYYAVAALDFSGNISAQSTPIAVPTP